VGKEDLTHRRRLPLRPDHRQVVKEVGRTKCGRGRADQTSSRSTSQTCGTTSDDPRTPSRPRDFVGPVGAATSRSTASGRAGEQADPARPRPTFGNETVTPRPRSTTDYIVFGLRLPSKASTRRNKKFVEIGATTSTSPAHDRARPPSPIRRHLGRMRGQEGGPHRLAWKVRVRSRRSRERVVRHTGPDGKTSHRTLPDATKPHALHDVEIGVVK